MYKIRPHENVSELPWELSLSGRLKKIFDAKKMGLKVVVYLYEGPDTSTFRYRVYNMCQALELSLIWHGTYFYSDELDMIHQFIENIDLVVICRFKWNSKLEDTIEFLHTNGIKVVFDTDDLIYDEKYIPMIMNTLSVAETQERLDYWFSYVGRIAAAARKCDSFITTNQYLADIMKNDLQKEVFIAKNFLNRAQIEVSEDYYQQKKVQCSYGQFVIGYFSGTPSHINDFLVVGPELKRALEECNEMVLKIVGFMEIPSYLDELRNEGKIVYEPLVNFIELQQKIAEVDVNIAPLVNNMFSNCKSELKYFEAAAVGTLTCATPTYVFEHNIEHGKDGYLCAPGEWMTVLKDLYARRKIGYSNINMAAYDKCIENYAYYNQIINLETIFEKIAGGKK